MPLGIENVSYALIYLAELKVKQHRTVATLCPLGQLRHVVVSSLLSFSITQHSSTGRGPLANSVPPYCLRVLACFCASAAAVDISTPGI